MKTAAYIPLHRAVPLFLCPRWLLLRRIRPLFYINGPDVLPQPLKTFYEKRKNKYFKGVEKVDTLFLRFISLNFLRQLAQLHPTLHPFLKLRLQCFFFSRKLL